MGQSKKLGYLDVLAIEAMDRTWPGVKEMKEQAVEWLAEAEAKGGSKPDKEAAKLYLASTYMTRALILMSEEFDHLMDTLEDN